MQSYFYDLGHKLFATLKADEQATLYLSGELTDFVRFNRGLYRQAGNVQQHNLEFRLRRSSREAVMIMVISGQQELDQKRWQSMMAQARQILDGLPDNPYLQAWRLHANSEHITANALPATANITQELMAPAHPGDFVGICAAGPTYRGFMSSLGQRNWHSISSFNVDASLHGKPGQAVKLRLAGRHWDPAAFSHLYAQACEDFGRMGDPIQELKPGKYRVYLSPTALEDIYANLGEAFGLQSQRTKTSTLSQLAEGTRCLAPRVTITEAAAGGLAPQFSREGVTKPAEITLVREGAMHDPLVSSRSAKEYQVSDTGANPSESPESLTMAAGDLAPADILKNLDDGLYINNLWYLNYSDRSLCRMTGLTRFANFVVKNGRMVAPMNVMRFDDSLYHMLGDGLQAITRERSLIASAQSYGERALSSMLLPGIVVNDFTLTF